MVADDVGDADCVGDVSPLLRHSNLSGATFTHSNLPFGSFCPDVQGFPATALTTGGLLVAVADVFGVAVALGVADALGVGASVGIVGT